MVVLGIDPGLRYTGWGVVVKNSQDITFKDCGVISTSSDESTPKRLFNLYSGLLEVINLFSPQEVAIEKTFVNTNNASSLKLAEARGVLLMTPVIANLSVSEYEPNTIKKVVAGSGHATKQQVEKMVSILIAKGQSLHCKKDATDALAVALCHCFSRKFKKEH